jgi:hypothetical protein
MWGRLESAVPTFQSPTFAPGNHQFGACAPFGAVKFSVPTKAMQKKSKIFSAKVRKLRHLLRVVAKMQGLRVEVFDSTNVRY